MNPRRDRLFWGCLAAWLALGASLAGTLLAVARLEQARPPVQVSANPLAAPASTTDAPPAPLIRWREPQAKPDGCGELFVPYELTYNPATDRHEGPPEAPAERGSPPPLRLELIALRREAYPVQLIGHVGSGPTLRGIFERVGSGETVTAKTGYEFPGLGLAVASLRVVRRPAEGHAARREAVAILTDALSGERVELRSGERRWAGPPIADVRVAGEMQVRRLRAGDRLELPHGSYRVARIGPDPEMPEIVAEAGGAAAIEWVPASLQ